jgi:hypothetical protein
MRRIRPHLTYANVMATIAVFIAISGGTAVALNGANTVQSDDLGPGAQVRAADVADNAVNSADVANESLTGADIKNRSGVDTCVNTNRLGNLCVRAENFAREWLDGARHCANLGLRQPTLGEARELATTHDIPNVDPDEEFWTADIYQNGTDDRAFYMTDDQAESPGGDAANPLLHFETVCVTTPSS